MHCSVRADSDDGLKGRSHSSLETLSASSFSSGYRTFGIDWRAEAVDFYLDGQLVGTLSAPSSSFNLSTSLMLSLEVDPNAGLPDYSELPQSMKVKNVRVWHKGSEVMTSTTTDEPTTPRDATSTAYLGYSQPAGSKVCKMSTAVSAGIKSLKGKGHSFAECAEGCESLFDCFYFTLSKNGWCFFYKTCDELIDGEGKKVLWQRGSTPTTPAPSAIAGYSLTQADMRCDISAGDSKPADRRSLGGGGHSLEACVEACNSQRSCWYFALSVKGFCKMFSECGTKVRFSGDLYAKDPYKLVSVVDMCDKENLEFKSLGGGGHTLEECQSGCTAQNACSHINWYRSTGYCHLFTRGCNVMVAASGGSMTYTRVGGALKPSVPGWTSSGLNRICRDGSDGVVPAPKARLWGGKHSLNQCTAACLAQGNGCSSVVFSLNKGFCKMYRQCAVLRYAGRNGRVVYTVSDASTPLGISGDNNTVGTGLGTGWALMIIGAILLLGFIWVILIRRDQSGYESIGVSEVKAQQARASSLS